MKNYFGFQGVDISATYIGKQHFLAVVDMWNSDLTLADVIVVVNVVT